MPGPGVSGRAAIVLVGAGRMGSALLKGWVAGGVGPLIVLETNPSTGMRAFARQHRVKLLRDARDVGDARVAACVVALKPQILKDQAGAYRRIAESGAVMISIAAGTTMKSLAKAWGRDARIMRAMPNTPGAIGRGITAICAGAKTTAEDRKLADRLLSALGQTVWVETESQIDAVTAVSGSGPAYVFLLTEALADAAVKEGLPRNVADVLARQTVIGAGALLDSEKTLPGELRRHVTSPGGTTDAALKILMAGDGLEKLMKRAVAAARKRARELGA